MKADRAPKTVVRRILNAIIIVFYVCVIAGALLGPRDGNSEGHYVIQSALMQTSRTIGLCLNQYAADNDGHYPEVKSSTEIFQKLLDGKYVTDPRIFYFSYLKIPGKAPPQSNQLKPENVCWDVTCCVDSTAPDVPPLVFVTGYKINYKAGASAVPLKATPSNMSPSWSDWWHGIQNKTPFVFFAVTYKNDSAQALKVSPDGSIPNFIPADFEPKGKVYRQLTPDGELPP